MSVYVRSILDGNRIRLRAIEGQKYNSKKNVQGSRAIRYDNPVGTIFECGGLSDEGTYYRAYGNLQKAYNIPVQYNPIISKTKNTKRKSEPINIVEFCLI
ncbi:MAG TPA: hypothetical protein VI911_10190 [Patescibacteria group bacterium]|nr:hypothetical protein [Patescibacteria group bacterium]